MFNKTRYINSKIGSYQIGDIVKIVRPLKHKNAVFKYLVKNHEGNYDCICPCYLSTKKQFKFHYNYNGIFE